MFTKYTSIKLPENYGGSRFKKSPVETEMKTHRPQEAAVSSSTIKTSVSPSFQIVKGSVMENEMHEDIEREEYTETNADDFSEPSETNYTEPSSPSSNPTTSDEQIQSAGIKELSRFLEKIKSDDLLLLSLILLLAKDGADESLDALILLALLLLYR